MACQLENKSFKEQRESITKSRPRRVNLTLDRIGNIKTWNPRMKITFMLKEVQVSPLLIDRVVNLEVAVDVLIG
ncbi:MAG: hypothetical protein COW13_04315 [Candidatus Omnitrophica bacterium CG12_big_fil_rev_8_21_14_0_65_50_5]|nr:MAG: hypothetical protein COW13_04315 [Candidatus Omnitrophica bacterium CG12_big_fil_rev_8_21_14_0_65_50_5]